MAGGTVGYCMISEQRKPAHLMHGGGILDDPGFGIMTPGTVWSQRILMHIGMTAQTFYFSFLKFQRLVARFTIYILVLTGKFKLCGTVIES
jgi:hypothetical protein